MNMNSSSGMTNSSTIGTRGRRGRGPRVWLIAIGAIVAVIAVIAVVVFINISNQDAAITKAARAATPVVGVTHVDMKNFTFSPAKIVVPVGTTVTWVNDDDAPHSVTFDNGMRDSGMRDSGLFQRGGTYSYTFTKPGTYDYHCTEHPYMVAEVIVTG